MIVVTAPTGKIGARVVTELLSSGGSLRLIARDASRLSAEVRDRVEVVEGSHGDAAVMDRALAGADALFWLPPPSLLILSDADTTRTLEQTYLDFTRPAVDAVRRHRVGCIVSVTALGRGTEWENKAGMVTASIRMDDALMASGAAFRGLAMPSFMDNLLNQAASIRDEGMFVGPLRPDRKMPTVATADIGAVAAGLLADETWSGQRDVPVLGPEDLSFDDMTAIMTDVLGRPVHYQRISFEAQEEQLVGHGVPRAFARGYVAMLRAKDEGMDNVARRTGETATPTSFRRWCEDNLAS